MFGWLKEKFSTRQQEQAPPAEQQLAAIQGVGDFLSPISYRDAESYLPSVVACIDYISTSLASLPVKLYRYDGAKKELVTDHPIANLLKNPNPQLNGMPELLMMSCIDLLAYGNCIITIDTLDDQPILTQIPWGLVAAPYREPYHTGYKITYPHGGLIPKSEVVPSSRVVHVRLACIDGGFIGRSPLARNNMTVALSKVVEKATDGLWRNGVYPSIAVKTGKILTPQQRTDARRNLITQLGGENRGKPMFLDADYSLEKLAANSKDLEHLDQRMFGGVVQICMIFGVSPMLIGDLRFSTYSNFDQARQAFALETLSTYQRLFATAFTRKLLDGENNLKIELDTSHLLQTRTEKATEVTELVKAGILSPEEGKKELGYG